MGFLAPFFLTGLLAIALPVAIHLIRREEPPKVPFGSLRFLKATKRKRVLLQQIQQWLLLAMRTGIIALLVLAFARPLFYQGDMGRLFDAGSRSVVLLLDRSLVMQYQDRDQQLRDRALAVLAGLNPGDEAGIVQFADSPLSVRAMTTDLESVRNDLAGMGPAGYRAPRFEPALRAADELLREARHGHREIVMLSAFQAVGMRNMNSDWRLAPGVGLQTVDLAAEDMSNLAILDVRAPDRLVEGENEHEVLARIRSNGTVHTGQARVSLLVNDEVVARDTVSLDDRSEAVARLPVRFESAGPRVGELRVEGDDFTPDNSHYFTMNVQPRTEVLLVNGSPSGNWYEDGAHWFELALSGEGMETPYRVTSTTASDFSATELASHDVLVLLDAGIDEPELADRVSQFVRDGGGLLLAAGRNMAAAGPGEHLEILPVRLRQAETLPGGEYLLLADRERRHPVFDALDFDWSARFHGYWRSEPVPEARILMRFDNGEPVLIEGEAGKGRILVLTTALDTSWGNLPLQGLYLPFVHEMLGYLVQPSEAQGSYTTGDRINLSSWLESGETLSIRGRNGQVTVSSPDPVFEAGEPGIFRIGEGEQQALAVNVAPDAGTMEKVSPDTLQDRLIDPQTSPVQSDRVRATQRMEEMEQPQRLWWWMLLLVMGLVLLETRVANRTYR